MRHKFALSIALAGFVAATAFGVGMAAAEPVVLNQGIGPQNTGLGAGVAAPETPANDCTDEEVVVEEPAGGDEEGCEKRRQREKTGVVQNQGIDAATTPADGGVTAPAAFPSATGGGDQPQKDSDGGSQFTDGGSPTPSNPSTTIAPFGPAPIGVPNFVIDSFEIPPFLLPIYQACGTEYGIPWEVLASINKIESAFGTNLNVSSAGALGWMQFMPGTWEAYGVDANGDGRKDPYNPVDAICAAAGYLKASGGAGDLYNAIFAYNHADWYVQEVLLNARAYGKLPSDLVGSLTGLTEGAHFPVAANARYADDIATREALRRATPDEREKYGNAAEVISSSPTRRGINIFAAQDAPVVAVNDGTIEKMGRSKKLGRFVVLQDAYGNSYTYAKLGRIVRGRRTVVMPTGKERRIPVDSQNIRPRLRALPGRVDERVRAGATQKVDYAAAIGADGTLKVGSKVIAGTVLGRIGAGTEGVDPHINFSIRPAGRGAPRIDPKPILDGWKLLEATAIYRAKGKNPFARKLGSAGVLLLSKEALQRRVLADERIEVYDCGRTDIASGQIDRRVLATLAYLAEKGYRLTIASLKCGHGFYTAGGNVSNHSSGNAVDIAVINGVPVFGHQGPGTLTDSLLKEVLRLQGTMVPEELISLEDLGGPSFPLSDHDDHVHIGWQPFYSANGAEARFVQLLRPDQWLRLTDQLEQIENPEVPTSPSEFSLPDHEQGKPAKSGGSGGSSAD